MVIKWQRKIKGIFLSVLPEIKWRMFQLESHVGANNKTALSTPHQIEARNKSYYTLFEVPFRRFRAQQSLPIRRIDLRQGLLPRHQNVLFQHIEWSIHRVEELMNIRLVSIDIQ